LKSQIKHQKPETSWIARVMNRGNPFRRILNFESRQSSDESLSFINLFSLLRNQTILKNKHKTSITLLNQTFVMTNTPDRRNGHIYSFKIWRLQWIFSS
jgi:hypothetical protein